MINMEMEREVHIPLFKFQANACPVCGALGTDKKVHGLKIYHCKRCNSVFREEMLISLGDREIELNNN